MKRKELRAYLGVTVWNGDKDHDADVYVKSLADSVMDEYEENIKELKKQLENAENAYYSLKMDMENRIKELEATISKMETTGWIAFEDKVPTMYQNILVNVPGANKENRMEPTRSIFWCPARIDELKHGMLYYTHWMPLPPPPKEEGK